MIVDLAAFVEKEKPFWQELELSVSKLEGDEGRKRTLEFSKRLYYLYQRAVSDLGRISGLPAENPLRLYLEGLVARAHMEIYDTRQRELQFNPIRWFFVSFPQTFRRHLPEFLLAVAVTLAGMAFGSFALAVDDTAKEALLPFSHLLGDPSERVRAEEAGGPGNTGESRVTFASYLFQNNLSVSIRTLAFGVFWGIGSVLLLFYNGVILGAVCWDYLRAGEGLFLAGWLLPHGATEIPSILLAGQAGLLLGRALIGWADPTPLESRLRSIVNDLVSLIGGLAVLLVLAAVVESFLSQYHAPVLPYSFKIAFGLLELLGLALLLTLGGRKRPGQEGR